jgi:hypothetical protein
MKKRYISPFVEIVDVAVTPLMTTTSPITAPEDEADGGRGNDIYQSGEFRGDWSNIWEGM